MPDQTETESNERLFEVVNATRRAVSLFSMENRGVLEVSGSDRVRWLDGMISGDVEALEKSPDGAGCYATLLTNRGAIVADLRVGRLGEIFLLESLRSELPRIQETLAKFVIADDVELVDRSEDWIAFGLEGPDAKALLQAALSDSADLPSAWGWGQGMIAGAEVLLAGFGFSGESGFQLRCRSDDRVGVEGALDTAAGGEGLQRGLPAALEILRVEAGIPALGRELDEEVLPPEARLEHAIATNKGCYVGQEIVARLRARGQVNHLLVGLRLSGSELPELGAKLSAEGRETGEITSVAMSPVAGPIALAYVRREHAEPGTAVSLDSGSAEVAGLPLVSVGGAAVPSTSDGSSVG